MWLFKVEAALTNDPESDELLKLKSDLNVSMLEVEMVLVTWCYLVLYLGRDQTD